jgi:hypothetical protein
LEVQEEVRPRKSAGILLIYLALSIEFAPSLVFQRVLSQQNGYEALLSRLEEYLMDILPPESMPVEECEYVAPDGFNASYAERLWRIVSPLVSMGSPIDKIRSMLQNSTPGEADGSILLDFNNTRVEKNRDGSVTVRIPVASEKPLNYTYCNSIGVRILYEAWNETLVRYYGVERYTGLYRYVVKDIETGVVFDFVSRLGVSPFPGFALEDIMLLHPEGNWPWFLGNPIIAVPGHYEEVKTLVPEHEESYRVLFPAYDPIIIEGWVVSTSVSSTSLSVGETLQISYWAEYYSFPGEEPEPLNATLTLSAPESFQPLNGVERKLSDEHKSGSFNLKAVKPGTYNLTLRLSGNAQFPHAPGDEETYTIQVVSLPAPSLSVEIVERDTSIPKHARLVLRLRNDGGSPARNVVVEIAGACLHGLNRSVGSVEAGEARNVELSLRLLNPSCEARIMVTYSDDEGNPYLVSFWTRVSTETFWVPEHFEEYIVTVPEHEKVTRIFVPGCEKATHVRFYWLTFRHPAPSYPGEFVVPMPTFQGHYGGFELVSHLTPTGAPELNASSWDPEEFGNPDMVLLSLEPYFEQVGVFEEKNAAEILGVKPGLLRSNSSIGEYRTRLVNQTWRVSGGIVMNATQFAAYNRTMNSFISENNLQGEFKIGWRRLTNATRLAKPSSEKGFLTLIYRPLSVKGSGPLKSIQVKNYAWRDMEYELKVGSYMAPPQLETTIFENVEATSLTVGRNSDHVFLSASMVGEARLLRVNLSYSGMLVARLEYELKPVESGETLFWRGFWDALNERLPGIAAMSGVMIGGSLLIALGATVSGLPSLILKGLGTGVKLAAFLYYLFRGVPLNIGEITHAFNATAFHLGQSYEYASLACLLEEVEQPVCTALLAKEYLLHSELLNFVSTGRLSPMLHSIEKISREMMEVARPRGFLASILWDAAVAELRIAERIAEDTVMDLFFDVSLTDVEIALSRGADPHLSGRAWGRITASLLSFTALVFSYKAGEKIEEKALESKLEAKVWNTKGLLNYLGERFYAWVTFPLVDLVSTILSLKNVLVFVVKHPVAAARIARLAILLRLKDLGEQVGESLSGRTGWLWESLESRLVERLRNAGSEEEIGRVFDTLDDCGLVDDAIGLVKSLRKTGGSMDWDRTVFRLLYAMADKGVDADEQASILRSLDQAARKWGDAENFVDLFNGLRASLSLDEDLRGRVFQYLREYAAGEDGNRILLLTRTLEALQARLEKGYGAEKLGLILDEMGDMNCYRFKLGKETGSESFQLGGEISPGTYMATLRVKTGGGVETFMFPVKTETQASKIKMPISVWNQIKDLNPYLIDVKLVDYRLAFPMDFAVAGRRLTADVFTNEMELDGRKVGFEIEKVSHREDELHVRIEIKNSVGIQAHQHLVLALSHRGSVELSPPGGGTIRPLEEIRWVNGHTIETVYVVEDVPQRGLFSFKSDDLESQLKNGLWEKETTISVLEEGEAKQRVSLKTFLFTELGWKAYDELKEKISDELKEKMEDNYVLVAEFDNGRIATCKSEGLTVAIPEGAESIRKVGVFSREGDGEFKFWLAVAMSPKAEEVHIGTTGEYVMQNYYMLRAFEDKVLKDDIIVRTPEEEKKRTGIETHADRILRAARTMVVTVELEGGKQIPVEVRTNDILAIMEVTSTKQVEEMMNNPGKFAGKMVDERISPIKDIINHIGELENVKFGIAAVLAFDPENVYVKGREGVPSKIGDYNNPLLKLFLNSEGKLIEVVRVVNVRYE